MDLKGTRTRFEKKKIPSFYSWSIINLLFWTLINASGKIKFLRTMEYENRTLERMNGTVCCFARLKKVSCIIKIHAQSFFLFNLCRPFELTIVHSIIASINNVIVLQYFFCPTINNPWLIRSDSTSKDIARVLSLRLRFHERYNNVISALSTSKPPAVPRVLSPFYAGALFASNLM